MASSNSDNTRKPSEHADELISLGYSLNASDIHIEPHLGDYRVLFRTDGLLQENRRLDKELGEKITTRFKVMAQLPVYIKNLPQDGHILWQSNGHPGQDLRVSVIPTIHGEKIVIRMFDEKQYGLGLADLGFPEPLLLKFKSLLEKPSGTILLTGPAGSGKTTTIYSALRHIYAIKHKNLNVVTVEDPVECDLGFATQIQVKAGTDTGYPDILRSVLRQDPEVIVVGEIRDKETGQLTISAGLTGHLVISTVHSGRAGEVFTRLMEMGIEPYLLASSVSGILSQRLLRLVCQSCKGEGCDGCRKTGYKNRTAIAELLVMDEPMRELILTRPTTQRIVHLCKEQGMQSIFSCGMSLVDRGLIDKKELYRVLEKDPLQLQEDY